MGMMSNTKSMEKQKERKSRASHLLSVRKFLMIGLFHLCAPVSTRFPYNGFKCSASLVVYFSSIIYQVIFLSG